MNKILQRRILTLTIQAALVSALAPAAFADTTDSSQTLPLGSITVAGKRAPANTDVKTDGPIEIISSQQLKQTGLTTVGDILATLTSMGSSATSNIINGNRAGEDTINLRNLGSNRVLVLVNGRRWVQFLQGETDLTTIPLSIVDHIEVLKSGASAQYGSEAMAGVVNIVTKRDVQGLSASAYAGEFMESGTRDGLTTDYQFTDGSVDDHGSMIFNASYMDQHAIPGGDRVYSSTPDYGTGISRGTTVTAQGHFIFIDPNTGKTENLTLINGKPGTSPGDFRPFDPNTDIYNFSPANYLEAPSKRTGLYLQGDRAVADNVTFHYAALYNDRRSEQSAGPAELSIGSQGTNPFSVSASNPYNPFGFDLNATGATPNLLLLARQPVELGPRFYDEDLQTMYFDAGADGGFDLGGHPFTWNADAIISRNRMTTDLGPAINEINEQIALGPISQCGPGTSHPSCVPLNVFGGQFGGGTITPAMIRYITYTAEDTQQNNMRDYLGSLSTPLVDLPAGPLNATLGYEYMEQDGQDLPDEFSAAGQGSETTDTPVSGGFNDTAIWLGLHAPILANLTAAKSLDLDAATRSSDYSTFGTLRSNLAALHWTVNEQVSFLASWSEDFRAPTIAELYTASIAGSASVSDPCSQSVHPSGATATNCAAGGVPANFNQVNPDVSTTSGRNPDLQPETSTSRTLGTSFTPWGELPLDFSIDYFKIEVDDAIGTTSAQNVLNGCYISGRSDLCQMIHRNASGAVSNVQATEINQGTLLTEGMDFGTRYKLATQQAGDFTFNWTTTWVKEFVQTQPNLADPSAPVVSDLTDTETGKPVGGYPKFKSELDAAWSFGPWQAMWRLHYISDLIEHCSDKDDNTPESLTNLGLCSYPDLQDNTQSMNKLGAVTYHDVQVSYAFNGGFTVTGGILNVFDKQPPIGHSMSDSFDMTIYPIPGRFVYGSVEYHF
ncbi:MAG TPA: TonB-dependent receptor [Gammaproteobacteria bacterium]|jgi:iron complex outermembrane receptor protein